MAFCPAHVCELAADRLALPAAWEKKARKWKAAKAQYKLQKTRRALAGR